MIVDKSHVINIIISTILAVYADDLTAARIVNTLKVWWHMLRPGFISMRQPNLVLTWEDLDNREGISKQSKEMFLQYSREKKKTGYAPTILWVRRKLSFSLIQLCIREEAKQDTQTQRNMQTETLPV